MGAGQELQNYIQNPIDRVYFRICLTRGHQFQSTTPSATHTHTHTCVYVHKYMYAMKPLSFSPLPHFLQVEKP